MRRYPPNIIRGPGSFPTTHRGLSTTVSDSTQGFLLELFELLCVCDSDHSLASANMLLLLFASVERKNNIENRKNSFRKETNGMFRRNEISTLRCFGYDFTMSRVYWLISKETAAEFASFNSRQQHRSRKLKIMFLEERGANLVET